MGAKMLTDCWCNAKVFVFCFSFISVLCVYVF